MRYIVLLVLLALHNYSFGQTRIYASDTFSVFPIFTLPGLHPIDEACRANDSLMAALALKYKNPPVLSENRFFNINDQILIYKDYNGSAFPGSKYTYTLNRDGKVDILTAEHGREAGIGSSEFQHCSEYRFNYEDGILVSIDQILCKRKDGKQSEGFQKNPADQTDIIFFPVAKFRYDEEGRIFEYHFRNFGFDKRRMIVNKVEYATNGKVVRIASDMDLLLLNKTLEYDSRGRLSAIPGSKPFIPLDKFKKKSPLRPLQDSDIVGLFHVYRDKIEMLPILYDDRGLIKKVGYTSVEYTK